MPVRIERSGAIAVIVIDNPPINAGSTAVRSGLLDAVAAVEADRQVAGAVLIGAGGTFIAGSDIREFGQPLQPPELPSVIAAIEAGTKPYVAALDGAALGGGFELALGCDARIADRGTVVGLPEVTLGMIPGAGGTQRLPRLVGVPTAIALICGGTRVPAVEALRLGLVDRLADDVLRDEAVALARSLVGTRRRISERPVPEAAPEAIEAAAAAARKAGRNRPPVDAAIRAVRMAADRPFADGLAEERAVFTTLRTGPEAAALRHLFFAERAAGRPPRGVPVRSIARVGVIGAGTMGAGIAASLLEAGLSVTLVDSHAAALSRGTRTTRAIIDRWQSGGRLDAARADGLRARLATADTLDALVGCDAVIEAIIEDRDAKTGLLRQLGTLLGPDTVIASNTSYLDLDALAVAAGGESRVLGLHFFNPPQVMRLLEVVRGARTSDETLATGLALARRMGKQPVIARVGHGFIGNRIYAAYRRQCEFMLEEGALPEQVDAALEAFGFAMGPFATGDLSGLDIAWAMRRAQAVGRDSDERYCPIADRLCEAGRLGRKTAAGWYAYPEGARRGVPDPAVRVLIEAAAAESGIARHDLTAQEIVERVLATMLNEAALLLQDGVAERASDIDVVFVHGYGFPRHEGGPLFWASRQQPAHLERALDRLAAASGSGFRRGDIGSVLSQIRSV